MPEPVLLLLLAAAAVQVLMLLAWWRQLVTRNANLVDVCWALAIGGVALTALALGPGDPWRRLLAAVLIGWWSLRLGGYLFISRVVQEREEDGRYAELRQAKGSSWPAWSFGFFTLQNLFVLIWSAPAVVLAWDPRPLGTPTDLIGGLVAIIALAGQLVADGQLRRWRADPANRGRTCRRGLWRYSRHPNYFCEWLFWCGVALLATGTLWSLVAWGQATIALLLVLFVTGIPYTERQALRSRGDDYRAYQRGTSPFIPWFPDREADDPTAVTAKEHTP